MAYIMTDPREYYHRHLPHWQPAGATFFVTFRLKGSLPYKVIEALHDVSRTADVGRAASLHDVDRTNSPTYDLLAEQRSFGRWDEFLDKAEAGPRWLSQPEVANVVKEALHYRDKRQYDLFAFSIMPNHVHTVFAPLQQTDGTYLPLNYILQFLKRHTARQANQLLGREGSFWQDESYDHVIRNNDEFQKIIYYVLENPVKAGLVQAVRIGRGCIVSCKS
jgi:putative transposase